MNSYNSYDEAMAGARKEGTEQRNKRRGIYRGATWGVGVVAILAALIWLPEGPLETYARWSKKEEVREAEKAMVQQQAQSQYAYGALIPMTSLPQSVWPNLGIQSEGKSSLIEIPKVGMKAVVLGNNRKTHVVYKDKSECVVEEENCKPGIVAFYVSNTSKEMNIVSYAFTY